MPPLDAPHMKYEPDADYRKWARMLDPAAPGKISSHARGQYNVPFSNITNLGGGGYRIANAQAAREARVGDVFHKQARVNNRGNFRAGNSQYVALQDITTYASPGGFINAPVGHSLVVASCKVMVKPGRYASTDADLVHSPGMTLGPWVENSVFWGAMDDYVNLRASRFTIVARTDRTVTITGGKVAAGDRVGLQDQSTGNAWARNVLAIDSTGTVLTLDGSPGTATYAYPYSGAAPKTVFRYNSMLGGHRYSVLARIKESVFEGNVFDRNGSSAMAFENHPWWDPPEGLGSEDVQIVDNEFRSIPSGAGGALWVAVMKENRTVATGARILDRIRIVGNTFRDWTGSAIHVNHETDSDIRCNAITSTLSTPLGGSAAAIRVNDSATVRIFDNRIDDPRSGYTPLLVTGSDGVTADRNGPTADPGACRLAPSRRGASSAPAWP
jgi:hypothetical protein